MFDGATSAKMIEDELAAGFRWLRFKPLVERDFERNIDSLRRRHLCIASLIGVILFDLFVFNDRVMVPDVFAQALLYRLGIFTPIALVILALLASGLSMRICDYLGIFVGVLAVAIIMALYLQSTSPFKPAYHYGAVIIIIFVAVVQRLMFRHCVCAVAAMFVVSFIALYQSHTIDPTTFQADVTFHATVALLAVFTAYGLERELRRSYLLRMRSKFLNAQLDQAAKIDPLTGLFNRRHLNEIMAAAWAETGKTRRSMGVILIDIDHFKLFNDTQGHLAGDACLQRMSCCLRATFGDAAVRFGGEEFMIFIAGLDATRVGRRPSPAPSHPSRSGPSPSFRRERDRDREHRGGHRPCPGRIGGRAHGRGRHGALRGEKGRARPRVRDGHGLRDAGDDAGRRLRRSMPSDDQRGGRDLNSGHRAA